MRTSSRCLASALAASAALAGPAAAEDERVAWQVPLFIGSNITVIGETMPWVAERLRSVSGGAIDLSVVEPGTVVPPLAIFENVSTGAIDAGYSWMGYEIGQVPASALFGATPFGLESMEFLAWLEEGGGSGLLEETFTPHDVKAIPCGSISPEAAGWFREEIRSVEDLRGLKFRAAGIGGEIMAEFGMAVTMLPGAELYQALETGVLDATEFSLPSVDEQLGFYQVAKHYYLPGWHQPSTNLFLYVNLGVWDGLGEQTRAQVETTCLAAFAWSVARAEALQPATLERFEAAGVTLGTYDDAMLDALHAATVDVMERRSKDDALFGRVYASMMDFQRRHQPWKELGYLPRDWMRVHVYGGEE
jgi:TRAP-type mannitol/chloroaromatic compound transport system substrate-binding protein